ncbi:hypothetical protein, partial [Lactococcus petauri]|uniref:hypothetical protein n=1 Tax=Lactococcus petauri TaxID=1940789 RepID=UPI0021F1C072
MASNRIYANPFGAAVEGNRAGLQDAIQAGVAGRHFRDADQESAYKVWHDPYRRNDAAYEEAVNRQKAYMASLQGATAAGVSSG